MAIIRLVIPLYVYGYITGVLSEMDDPYWLNEITSSAVIITKQKTASDDDLAVRIRVNADDFYYMLKWTYPIKNGNYHNRYVSALKGVFKENMTDYDKEIFKKEQFRAWLYMCFDKYCTGPDMTSKEMVSIINHNEAAVLNNGRLTYQVIMRPLKEYKKSRYGTKKG